MNRSPQHYPLAPRGGVPLPVRVGHDPDFTPSILPPATAPRLPGRIRLLLYAAYATRGGSERMTLNDWRDVEEEMKRRLENETL